MTEKLDIIIFGATGFTGKHCIYEGVKLLSKHKWGIAGRSRDKLEAVLKEMAIKAGVDLSKTPIIIADVGDEESLRKMAEQCKIVVNCCGPYRFYGEAVVKACVEAGTHHVDISGEPQFMEGIQLKYNDQAKEKGVYIISACGFDSIPADMGIIFLEQNFDGEVNSIETYLTTETKPRIAPGSIHFGTWESAVYAWAHLDELDDLRSKLFRSELPKLSPTLISRPAVHRSDVVNKFCLPFIGVDRSVVERSQRVLYETEKKRPVQVRCYFTLPALVAIIPLMIISLVFIIMARFEFGRKMLLKYPRIFTAGLVSHEGPSEEIMKNTKFFTVFKGLGWNKTDPKDKTTGQYSVKPTKKLITKVTGTNPGYGATCVALLLSATTILSEKEKMPNGGGVLPPGAAFAKTNLISELCKNGFKFEVIPTDERNKNKKFK